ncbi:right-handed parallel beta-helix repeat-containing protein [uncultured Acidaminococcus sp.]|uniref:right-handed parallel beta-helix repeat-containing protein n=1 Tax=uncultured Acidaminococcus sp. TaxID=352152 RepID=UPI00261B0C9E|nr:right-handed parallel beta-helix repeat-containing protein [uncultured Acidaminococcus sp.]
MKKVLVILFALIQLLTAGALAASRQTVLVNNVEEMMEALGDHREIILAPGRYNLSHWLKGPFADQVIHRFPWNPLSPSGLYLTYDELALAGFRDLTIRGQDTGEITAEIVTEDSYTPVLHFRNCENLRLAHLRIGHFLKKGYCSGAVLNLDNAKNVSMEHLDLYGCGTYGYEARNSENIILSDSVIRNCTYGLVDAVVCRDLKIVRTVFKDTSTNLPLFALAHSRLELRDCTFHNVYGKMENLSVTGGSAE